MAQRLIDADALEKAIYEWMPKNQEEWLDGDLPPIENLVVSIMMTIQEQPTIDAVPIEWIEMRIRGLRGQLVNADADDKDLIWDLRTKIDELGGIAEYWRKEYETD